MNTNETLPKIAEDITALIGGTPMLRVRNLDTGPCTLLLKLECQTRVTPSKIALRSA